jgi:hypothetical protein
MSSLEIERLTGSPFAIKAKMNSAKIMRQFEQAALVSAEYLEKVKNEVDAENKDFVDIGDLLAAMNQEDSRKVYALFFSTAASLPLTSMMRRKVISDVDNTIFENSLLAPPPPPRRSGDLIPGAIPLIRALSNNGITTPTFVSARPNVAEMLSIQNVKRQLQGSGLRTFSFKSGTLTGPLLFVGAKMTGHSKLLKASFQNFGKVKAYKTEELRKVYPAASFVFLGDDTQGDYLFAAELISRDPLAFAFIRKSSTGSSAVLPSVGYTSDRIIYHESYYEAIAKAPISLLPSLQPILSFIHQELVQGSVNLSNVDSRWLRVLLNV